MFRHGRRLQLEFVGVDVDLSLGLSSGVWLRLGSLAVHSLCPGMFRHVQACLAQAWQPGSTQSMFRHDQACLAQAWQPGSTQSHCPPRLVACSSPVGWEQGSGQEGFGVGFRLGDRVRVGHGLGQLSLGLLAVFPHHALSLLATSSLLLLQLRKRILGLFIDLLLLRCAAGADY